MSTPLEGMNDNRVPADLADRMLREIERQNALIASQAAEIESLKNDLVRLRWLEERRIALIQSMREAIDALPHESMCEAWGTREDWCNCWKAALAQVSASPLPTVKDSLSVQPEMPVCGVCGDNPNVCILTSDCCANYRPVSASPKEEQPK